MRPDLIPFVLLRNERPSLVVSRFLALPYPSLISIYSLNLSLTSLALLKLSSYCFLSFYLDASISPSLFFAISAICFILSLFLFSLSCWILCSCFSSSC